jgi:hypothetical protein
MSVKSIAAKYLHKKIYKKTQAYETNPIMSSKGRVHENAQNINRQLVTVVGV